MTISGNEVSGYTLMDKSSTVYRRLLTQQFLLLRVTGLWTKWTWWGALSGLKMDDMWLIWFNRIYLCSVWFNQNEQPFGPFPPLSILEWITWNNIFFKKKTDRFHCLAWSACLACSCIFRHFFAAIMFELLCKLQLWRGE